jgi:hypothetical protein
VDRARACDTDVVSSYAERPDAARSRFDRALDRDKREQTALLDWLAESQQAEPLRDAGSAAEIDLRHDVVIDLRHEDRRLRTRDLGPEIDGEAARSIS